MIRLEDGNLQAQIDPACGNSVRSLRLGGEEFVWTGAEKGHLDGIPLVAPWANRIDGLEYFANGRKYVLNPALENLRIDANGLPIHGLLLFTDAWKLVRQDARSVTSRIEFWRRPEWMAQFPFAHAIEITHRIRDGALEIETAVENFSDEPMPLCVGFHPYMRLPGSARDDWRVHIAAREQVILSAKMVPTGERKSNPLPNPFPLRGAALDHVFSNLSGEAFVIENGRRRIEVRFGPKYPVAIVYSPPGGEFACIEPMSALTNAFNLEYAGIASGLQRVAPGETWREIFSITPVT